MVKNEIFAIFSFFVKNRSKKGLNQKSVPNILKSGQWRSCKKNWARSDINPGNSLSLSIIHGNYGQKRQKQVKVCFLPNADILDYGNDKEKFFS